jgi:hypothetical protein
MFLQILRDPSDITLALREFPYFAAVQKYRYMVPIQK